jgi:hypothetical protein
MRLTREIVLKGSDLRLDIPAREYGEDAVFTVAPPTAGDMAEARAIRLKYLEVKDASVSLEDLIREGRVDFSKINLSSAQRGIDEARFHLVSRALSRGMDEEWKVEDVKQLKPEVFERLWRAVDGLCGFTAEVEEQIRNFRKAQKARR